VHPRGELVLRVLLELGAFDLSNSAISMLYSGSGYVVLPGLTAYVPPSGAATTAAPARRSTC
jgi:hypothetical protein